MTELRTKDGDSQPAIFDIAVTPAGRLVAKSVPSDATGAPLFTAENRGHVQIDGQAAGLAMEATMAAALGAILAKLPADPTTGAKQDAVTTAVQNVVSKLSNDPATQTTLAAVLQALGGVVLAAGAAVIGKVGLQVAGQDVSTTNPFPVAGGAPVGSAPVNAPVSGAGVDGGGLKRHILTDTRGATRTAAINPDGTDALTSPQAYPLLSNAAASASGAPQASVRGGDYLWRVEGALGTSVVTLQTLSLDGQTWTAVKKTDGSDLTMTVPGSIGIGIGQGATLRAIVGAGTGAGIYSSLAGL